MAIAEPLVSPDLDVIDLEIVGAKIIHAKFVGDKIVDGQIIDGRVIDPKNLAHKAARSRSIHIENTQTEIIAVVALGLFILTLHFW
jgi:hypothetical protein